MLNTISKIVLVSGASGIVGYGILKSLRGLNYKLIGTTIYENSPANCFCDIFELAPKTTDVNYINWLIATIKKHRVNIIIPSIEDDMIIWNENKELIEQTGVFILLNNSNLIKLCSDKWLFYKKLLQAKIPYLIKSTIEGSFDEIVGKFGLPFLLKPRRGFASKGIVYVENEEIFNQHKDNLGKILMAQPIVGNDNEEYTISAFFSKNSKLLCLQQLKRKLSKDGFTAAAEVIELPNIKKILKDFAKILKPIGATNFQFRIVNSEYKLLEINPRISSSTSIRTAFGYNEAKMSIEYFLENKVIVQPILKKGKATRYLEDFIEYDSNNF